jgi:hypothetical protein
MKRWTGWVMSAGLVMAAGSAQAQVLDVIPDPVAVSGRLLSVVSDFNGPYAAMPPEVVGQRPYRSGYGYGPSLLPPREVYSVLRESGFLPLGAPRQRGFVYTIAVMDHRGNDGRLVIDARDGRIVRFVPAYRTSDNFNNDLPVTYGPEGPLPPINPPRGELRPPAPVPRLASRTSMVPLPKAAPSRAGVMKSELKPEVKPALKPETAKSASEPPQQSAAMQVKPADASPPPPAPAPTAAAKPDAPQILPTQEMPKVQGLE